jgi:formyltetrahydrofolate deformylase
MTHRLLVSCPDGPGIVSAIAGFLTREGANITHSGQYSTDPRGGVFFLRMQFDLTLGADELAAFRAAFDSHVARRFGMTWILTDAERPKRIAVFVSRYEHCLLDVLWRWRRRELHAQIAVVISNHEDLRDDVEAFGLPFVHIPVDKDRKAEAEARQLEVLEEHGPIDVVILARYMQILSADFLGRVDAPIVNIHHSFLPAFAGASPYQRAQERGVKLIGATAHYVTEELDAGPIIEQDVTRVTHEDDAARLARRGADIERAVFARAVQWHCDDRVLLHGNTTVVF